MDCWLNLKILATVNGEVKSISVGSSSIDFGRAEAEGRQRTCDLFSERLGGMVSVINSSPEPDKYDKIIDSQN